MIRGSVAALALLGALLAPAAAARDAELVVTGSRTGTVTVDVPRGASIVFDRDSDDAAQPRIAGGREYAGVVVRDRYGELLLYDARLDVRTGEELPRSPLDPPAPDREKARDVGRSRSRGGGRWTILLLADAPATVRLTVRGMAGRTVRVGTPLPVTVGRAAFQPVTRTWLAEGRVPVTLRRASTVLVYSDQAITGAGAGEQYFCLVPPGAGCSEGAPAWARRAYGSICLAVCVSARNAAGSGFSWLFVPRVTGRFEGVAYGRATAGVATDGRLTMLVVG